MTEANLTPIERAEQVISRLQNKRAAVAARVAEIAKERERVGYAVHANGDAKGRKVLDALNNEAITIDGELVSLAAAIVEGEQKLEALQRQEEMAESRRAAAAAKTLYKRLAQLGEQLDQYALGLVSAAGEAARVVTELHQLSCPTPNGAQFGVLSAHATDTFLMTLPWRAHGEYRHLAPRERRTFGSLYSGWSTSMIADLDRRLNARQKPEDAHAA